MEDVRALLPGRTIIMERVHGYYTHSVTKPFSRRDVIVAVLPGLNGDTCQHFFAEKGPILDQIKAAIKAEKLEGRAA